MSIIQVDTLQKRDGSTFPLGKLGQMVTTTFTGTESTTVNLSSNNSYTTSSVAATLTPTATSSKILVLISLPSVYASNRSRPTRITIRRHTTNQSVGGSEVGSEVSGDFHMNYMGGSDQQVGRSEYNFLDSPSTVAETFYQVYFSSHNSDNTSYIGQSSVPNAHITLLEIDGS